MVSLQDFDISSLRLVGARRLSRYDLFNLSDYLQHYLHVMKIPEPFCCEGLYSTLSREPKSKLVHCNFSCGVAS